MKVLPSLRPTTVGRTSGLQRQDGEAPNEEFMKDFDWLDDLKIRFGYGVTGNNDFSANLYGQYVRLGHELDDAERNMGVLIR